jgi:acyl-CoA synthetase (NDP forming)
MFAQPHKIGAGGLVSIHDSGGERQLLIDLAQDAGVPLAQLSPASTAKLEKLLDPGLPALNPLDAWSTGGPDFDGTMEQCFETLMNDPQAALGAVVHDRVAGGGIHAGYLDYLRKGHRVSGKPAFLVANRQGTGADALVVAATREGFPVLDGLESFLRGVRHLLDHRDFAARGREASPEIPAAALARMRARLSDRRRFDESEVAALSAARELGFPVVLKTAKRGVGHKSELKGIHLGVADQAAVAEAYRDLAKRIDPRVLVAPMISAQGVEMLLGMVNDAQFGPVVLIGAGGVYVEALADVVYAIPPFDAAEAARLVARLRIAPLLRSRRHKRPLAVAEFCRVAERFSALVAEIGDGLSEIDLNPVIVHADGCAIVDALVCPRPAQDRVPEPMRQAR